MSSNPPGPADPPADRYPRRLSATNEWKGLTVALGATFPRRLVTLRKLGRDLRQRVGRQH
jgi:hypothetical protein